MKLSIIIPVYNEERTILPIIKRVKEVNLPDQIQKEIIIVDDGSTDQTAAQLKNLSSADNLKILFLPENEGKAAAVRLGLKEASGDFILIQDADLEYDPRCYPYLLEPLLENQAAVVFGSRFKGKIKGMTTVVRWANVISNKTINLLYRCRLTDLQTCYKVFRSDIIKGIKIQSKNFTFDTEVTLKLLEQGHKIVEVPVNYTARTKKEGKKMNWLRALETYFFLVKYKFRAT